MPHLCCVPLCKGNYPDGPKVSVFQFPSDDELKRKWLNAIKRDNFVPTKASRVCELHFSSNDIERVTTFFVERTGEMASAPLKIPRLVKGAIPSKLPGAPQYLSKAQTSKRVDPEAKRQKREHEAVETAIAESIDTARSYQKSQMITSLSDIYTSFLPKHIDSWNIIKTEHHICFVNIIEDALEVPVVRIFVSINSQLNLSFRFENKEMKIITTKNKKICFPLKVNTINEIEDTLTSILAFCGKKDKSLTKKLDMVSDILLSVSKEINEDKKQAVDFIVEQIKLITVTHTNSLRYTWETLLFCSLLNSISPHAYKFLRNSNVLVLPCTKTLKTICSNFKTDPKLEQSDANFLQYVSSKFKLLQENDKLVVLMLDEIHLKPYFDFKAGNIVGGAYDSSDSATSAHVFMINSLRSTYKEVVHILPVRKLKAESLQVVLKKVIVGLENIGFEVCVVVTDNHAINRKTMQLFSEQGELTNVYKHPVDPQRPLFFLIDSVHLLKNIRNNWINQKSPQTMKYPDFDMSGDSSSDNVRIASFNALKEMHSKEKDQLLKHGYTLSLKALYPTSVERQNVRLVLQIFNVTTVTALRELGPKISLSNFEDTALYIEVINRWWDIVNVKTMFKGIRLRNKYQEPVTKNSLHIFAFFKQFIDWLNKWQRLDSGDGKLTKDTHNALLHTTEGYLKILNYLLYEKNFNFVLLGNAQTDKLEERFGNYRSLAGSQYHVSIRQIFESESKLRIRGTVPLIIKSKKYGDVNISKEDITLFSEESRCDETNIVVPSALKQLCTIDESSLEDISDNVWPSLIYISGYASYSLIKRIKCDYCKVFLTDESDAAISHKNLITSRDRGGLCYPSQDVSVCSAFTYIILENLLNDENVFLNHQNQRSLLIYLTLEAICDSDINIFLGFHCENHTQNDLIKSVIHTTANILLKNYTKKRNDIATTKTMPHLKRIKPGDEV